ncbi:hypothetical protein N474_23130 [Pseudoalteromonas luteoviolacea CPMOR-2]|uniref:Kelch repeat-containing protein n=1 Tax=Pseudoalteromonas luteoviolacea TaxID=43657 RepID=UPI0007B167D4|nr:kelch repeat-containing protein [Pseudoalteromonas luteoviolacea]KZN52338.1 hypothetical protein N474_23130 [Pseudoalteromonas luteoviolacea CPMOR-2]
MHFPTAKSAMVALSFVLFSAWAASIESVEAQVTSDNVTWHKAPELPIAMQEIYPAVFKERIVVGGGFTPSDSPSFFGLGPSSSVYLLNPPTGRWQKKPSLPEPRHHLGMVSNRHYVYGIGGFAGKKDSAWQIQRSVYRLDGTFREWRKGPSLPIPLAESVYANVGKNIHVIGGKTVSKKTGKNVDSDAHFVLVNNAYWRKAKPAKIVRNSAASAVIGDKIYVIGGRTSGENSVNLQDVEVYDSKKGSWAFVAPLPVAAGGLSASVLNGKIIVTGGEVFGPKNNWKAGQAFKQVWSYDPQTDSWEALPDMPTPRHGHGMVTLNNTLYIIGGAEKVGPQQPLSSVISIEGQKPQ